MADYNRWSQNQFTIGLKGDLNDASNRARQAENEAALAKQRAQIASSMADDASDELLKAKHALIDKNAEIRKLNQKLEETEAQLQKKFSLLKDFVLSQIAWKAVAQKIASEHGIDENNLQEQVDKVALDHANQNPNHGFETTKPYKDAKERTNKRKISP